jgi:hypothetical protein
MVIDSYEPETKESACWKTARKCAPVNIKAAAAMATVRLV